MVSLKIIYGNRTCDLFARVTRFRVSECSIPNGQAAQIVPKVCYKFTSQPTMDKKKNATQQEQKKLTTQLPAFPDGALQIRHHRDARAHRPTTKLSRRLRHIGARGFEALLVPPAAAERCGRPAAVQQLGKLGLAKWRRGRRRQQTDLLVQLHDRGSGWD